MKCVFAIVAITALALTATGGPMAFSGPVVAGGECTLLDGIKGCIKQRVERRKARRADRQSSRCQRILSRCG
jgi:hypothetical protein